MVGPLEQPVPIISYAGWFEGQTWGEFVGDILSIMLGQLAKNIKMGIQDQEVFVMGFHGIYLYIARGFFTADVISRVHLKGLPENEDFDLKFTHGYNLSLKDDWAAAMHAFSRLFRYLLNGRAEVGALQVNLHRNADYTGKGV
ncbi:hypothetical protein ASPWEDRAFT_179481 [Aspergillus wentii DTO 134E9]|uniref:Uncharacterized protein n=1 Tax=Aspergillus wentii DTO 134E9 TaxID=1073089 RepID=A0A1L9S3Q1_ASPWE|nr:uncharacterized protein ASPWEDRAFT_179481 [Aspergillus wentii DTO 134E9]KAI9930117.1 hypothetical protein MW887_011927 [Aspergillus wentii]OJJ41780.1 hypothetical protein ASPWEDRAFT_179481 [Aspergillus wentii DTO 134E9]